MTGTSGVYLCTCMIVSRWILFGVRNVSEGSCRESRNTHFMFNILFFRKCTVYENVETGKVKYDNEVRCLRIACWIMKATNTHSYYVILIAFPRHQWLRERASMLRYNTLPALFTYTVRSESRCALRLRYTDLVVSIEKLSKLRCFDRQSWELSFPVVFSHKELRSSLRESHSFLSLWPKWLAKRKRQPCFYPS
jgi:hypothetical protein